MSVVGHIKIMRLRGCSLICGIDQQLKSKMIEYGKVDHIFGILHCVTNLEKFYPLPTISSTTPRISLKSSSKNQVLRLRDQQRQKFAEIFSACSLLPLWCEIIIKNGCLQLLILWIHSTFISGTLCASNLIKFMTTEWSSLWIFNTFKGLNVKFLLPKILLPGWSLNFIDLW